MDFYMKNLSRSDMHGSLTVADNDSHNDTEPDV
eukprot:UN20936